MCGRYMENMEPYAKAKEGFLRTFLDLPNGIPSDDTLIESFPALIAISLKDALLGGLVNW